MVAGNIPLDPVLADAVADIEDRSAAGAGIRAMRDRAGEFSSEAAMLLAGAAMTPQGRQAVDDAVTAAWARKPAFWSSAGEVVIGAGFHAAVYAACRVAAGYPKPVVLDREPAAMCGGVFRASRNPSFWLNSENRPGRPGFPRDGGQLNYLPGAVIQPAMIDGGEFTDNAAVAWVIRVTLAQFAQVIPGITVTGYNPEPAAETGFASTTDTRNGRMYARRVIDARGLGDETSAAGAVDGNRIMTFRQLMAKADDMFPCRGMDRVAVIGDGDSARCAVERLVGIGPTAGMRTAYLDGAPQIGWYGPGLRFFADNAAWRAGTPPFTVRRQRGRYMRLASYLPLQLENTVTYNDGSEDDQEDVFSYRADAYHDVTIYPERGDAVRFGDGVLVNGRPYSHAVLATGWALPSISEDSRIPRAGVSAGGRFIARRYGGRVYQIGPAAQLPFDDGDKADGADGAPDNEIAMFRLAGRTAQLAASLPAAGS